MDVSGLQPLLAAALTEGISPYWLVGGLATCAVVYLQMRPKKRDPLSSQPFRSSLSQQKALERDMQNVVVELSEMTRQMSSQLETRYLKLERLIHEADLKAAELQQTIDAIAAQADALAPPSTPPPVSRSGRPTLRLVSDANDHTEERWAEVYRLSDEGLSLVQIARQLGRPNGEIELILALRTKSKVVHREIDVDVSEPPNIASAQ